MHLKTLALDSTRIPKVPHTVPFRTRQRNFAACWPPPQAFYPTDTGSKM